MSHDIRTPMNAVLGFTTLLAKDAENPAKVREYTKKITAVPPMSSTMLLVIAMPRPVPWILLVVLFSARVKLPSDTSGLGYPGFKRRQRSKTNSFPSAGYTPHSVYGRL